MPSFTLLGEMAAFLGLESCDRLLVLVVTMVRLLSYLVSDLVEARRLSSFFGVAASCFTLGVLSFNLGSGDLSFTTLPVDEVRSLLV